MAYARELSTQEVEAEGSGVLGHPQLHKNSKASLVYIIHWFSKVKTRGKMLPTETSRRRELGKEETS